MESTEFESHIYLLRGLRWPALLTADCTGVFRERQQYANWRNQEFVDDILDTLEQCGNYLTKITNLAEQLALSGRGFPVSLRMEIEDQLGPYTNFWTSDCIAADPAVSSLNTLQKIYDDLSLHACVDLKCFVSTLELV